MQTFVTVGFVLLLSFMPLTLDAARPNTQSKSGSKGTRAPVRRELVIDPVEKKQFGSAELVYSPARNTTSVFFIMPVIYKLETIELQVSLEVAGRDLSRVESVEFMLLAYKKASIFSTAKEIVINSDGHRYNLSILARRRLWNGFSWRHLVSGRISFAEYDSIAKSSSVGIKVGAITLELVEAHREAMRDVLKAVAAQ